MADMHYSDRWSADDGLSAGSVGRVFNFIGAVSAVVLIAGLTWWGYQLLVRDVTGVPVVRALEGPSRVKAENPGGELAQHQGLAVNSVQSNTELQDASPVITMAPAPVDLAAEDAILADPDAAEVATVVPMPTSQPIEAATSDAVNDAIALALLDDTTEGAVPVNVSGVKASPRPNLRPRINLAAYMRLEPVVASTQLDLDPTTIAPGTRLVQLGAFDDRDKAIAKWDTIAIQFNEYLGDKNRVVQEAQSGGQKFYRLRVAGFEDMGASQRFCSVLRAQNASCIPVAAR